MPVLRTTQGHEEFEEAQREGMRFLSRAAGRGDFVGDGRLDGRRAAGGSRSVFDANGRFAPQYNDSDLVNARSRCAACSPSASSADLSFLTPEDGVALTPGGTIRSIGDAGDVGARRVCRRRRRLRPAQPHRSRRQRQARGPIDSRISRRRSPPSETLVEIEKHADARLPNGRRLRASIAKRRRRSTSAAAPASPRSRPATDERRCSRRRAASSATSRPSTTPRSASSATAAWTSAQNCLATRALRRARSRRVDAAALTERATANHLPLSAMVSAARVDPSRSSASKGTSARQCSGQTSTQRLQSTHFSGS